MELTLFFYSLASKINREELTEETSNALNQDWIEYPQLC